MPNLGYRPNATILVTDGRGRLLICERAQLIEPAVQTVQGGIDDGETPAQAAVRELHEEIGLKEGSYELIGPLPTTWKYAWPQAYTDQLPQPSYIGQEQHYFLVTIDPKTAFDLNGHQSHEFKSVRWGSPQELVDGIWPPKRGGLVGALKSFGFPVR
jgi:putative (di)nucleoside polyphosphate hydrolase